MAADRVHQLHCGDSFINAGLPRFRTAAMLWVRLQFLPLPANFAELEASRGKLHYASVSGQVLTITDGITLPTHV